MTVDAAMLVIASFPNWVGFLTLAYLQWRTIQLLLKMLDDDDD